MRAFGGAAAEEKAAASTRGGGAAEWSGSTGAPFVAATAIQTASSSRPRTARSRAFSGTAAADEADVRSSPRASTAAGGVVQVRLAA